MRNVATPAFFAFLAVCFLTIGPASADYQLAAKFVPKAELVGKARFKYLVWNVFDAQLYAPEGNWQNDEPFALTLTYLREISGKLIAKSTIDEIRKQGFTNRSQLIAWQKILEEIFPDVQSKSQITGVRNKAGKTLFYHNGRFSGTLDDTRFTKQFFDIWLGSKASDRSFRRRLLGQS